MRIGDMSAATGVSPRLLRYYEERGLLAPSRTASGQRRYDDEAIERVDQIRRLLAAGLNTARINDLLPCLEAPPTERTAHLLDSLRDEQAKIAAAQAALDAAGAALDELVDEILTAELNKSAKATSGV